MTTGQIMQLGKEMLLVSLYLGAPVLVTGMVVGLIVSVIQAVTQIQEQSVSFVVKIVASAVALLIFGPWMLTKILDFSGKLLGNLDKFIH